MNLQAFENRDRYVVEVDGCVIEDDGIPLIDEFEANALDLGGLSASESLAYEKLSGALPRVPTGGAVKR